MSILSKIDSLPPLRQLVEEHGLWADKSFGQNYLFDLNITRKIARSGGDLSGHTIFEIGPGPGGLTRALLAETEAKQIIAIEKDRRFIQALQPLVDISEGRLQVIQADATGCDLVALSPEPRTVIANLPYNIGTELLISWLHQAKAFSRFILMFQKEVALRIIAQKGGKTYGRLSVLAQALCDADILFHLSPNAFTPAPKVTSSVVRLVPKQDMQILPIREMEKITAAAFGQRRKMLRQSLKPYQDVLEKSGINPQLRAEELGVEDYLRLARLLSERA